MITIENLTKKYGMVEALKGLTLEISFNEILAIVGPSGCGKTTLLRVIAGLESPDEGKVLIDGVEVSTPSKLVAPSKRGLSMIFQDLALWPHMTVKEHIEFVLKKNKLSRDVVRSRIDKILTDVNLSDYDIRYPHELSGGEKQRLAIARALAPNPAYLLMDEPFSNLDSLLKEVLQKLIKILKNSLQMGIVCVTHNIEESLALADRMAIMNKGIIEQIGYKEVVFDKPKNEFIRRFLKIT
jgi:iron(III) transport system ATP-binding protein